MKAVLTPLVGLLAPIVPAQELLWEVHSQYGSGLSNYGVFPSFDDWNGDGSEDALVFAYDLSTPLTVSLLRVLSGTDGTLLHECFLPVSPGLTVPIGDFDRDGYMDVAYFRFPSHLEVWSIVRRTALLTFPIVSGFTDGAICAGDLNGDGALDIVHKNGVGTLVATNHFGATLYTLPAYSFGFNIRDLATIGDVDGDGRDDFLAGGTESISGVGLGALILFSGATGTPLRIHFGSHPFGGINSVVQLAGDVDGDGVGDYACGNRGYPYGLVMIWSGATGVLIREWFVPVGELYGNFIGGRDVDLDGRPDIINFAGAYPNVGFPSNMQGRVRLMSSRDGHCVQWMMPPQPTNGYAQNYADLGVQPGNPYPVFVVMDDPIPSYNPAYPRLRAYRASPAGTRFVGSGCSSTGSIPNISIRPVDNPSPVDSSRLVLGSAPSDSLAICVVAPANVTTAGGITTPFALDPLGLIGCQLLVPDVIHHAVFTGSTGMDRGYAAFDFPQAMAATGGTLFAAQWLVLDTNTLGYATTARYEFRVQ